MDRGSDVTQRVIGCAIEVHRTLGPGLLEAIYETCLCKELARAGIGFARQVKLPVFYKGEAVNIDLRIDLVIEHAVVLEIKAVHQILPVHEAQLLTYLRVSGLTVGLLLNFNEQSMRNGIRRRVLRYADAGSAGCLGPVGECASGSVRRPVAPSR